MKAVLYENFTKSGDPKEYPIFEIKKTITPNSVTTQTPAGMPKCLCFYWAGADLTALFPDWDTMPHQSTDAGSLIRTKSQYELDTDNIRRVLDSPYNAVPIGVKPDDWDDNWMYYGTVFNTYSGGYGGSYAIYAPNIMSYTDTYPTKAWDVNTQYYHNDPLDTDYRMARVFCTDNNGVYGISACTLQNYAYGYWGILSRRGGLAPFYAQSDGTFASFPCAAEMWTGSGTPPTDYYSMTGTNVGAGCVLGFMATDDIDTGGILTYHNQMFIVVHYVDTDNDDEDYYGYALLNMDNANGDLTIVRCVLFDLDFWGDSIQPDGPTPPDPGNWGDDSTPDGGDGTFTFVSDDSGTTDGSYLDTTIQQRASHMSDIMDQIYQIRPQANADVVGVLYGSSFWSRFQNYMYNPLSCILSYHLIPEVFIDPYQSGGADVKRDLTAGGFNITTNMQTPEQFVILKTPVKAHIGSISLDKYFGAYPDFAPYTTARLHLPYIGDITLVVVVDTQRQPVGQEAGIETEVNLLGGLPSQIGVSQLVRSRTEGGSNLIYIILIPAAALRDRSCVGIAAQHGDVTVTTPRSTELQEGNDIRGDARLKELLIADGPTCRN